MELNCNAITTNTRNMAMAMAIPRAPNSSFMISVSISVP